MKNSRIDLNADVGERPEALIDGSEEKIMSLISSANIACGGHAGDENTMRQVLNLCATHGIAAGAHPSYPDRQNFGRVEMRISIEEIQNTVFEQVRTLGKIAGEHKIKLHHVKPHGALYNVAARDRNVAEAIARGVALWGRDLILVGLAGSIMLEAWKEMGFHVAAEAFADRVYESNGELRSRTKPDALITDPERAAQQAIGIIKNQKVYAIDGAKVSIQAQTICVHSDTPNAEKIISTLRARLKQEGIFIKSPV
jgi:UPF0271 protein